MKKSPYVRMIVIAFVLLVIGVVFPFLMVIKVLRSTFFLNFFSYAAMLAGMMVGIIGLVNHAIEKRKME